jgi:hypothetical protein
MTLSNFAILLGACVALFQIWAILKPAQVGASLQQFHRSESWGYVLMAVGTVWFLVNLNTEAIAEFAAYKPYMMIGFGGIAVAACIFVTDYLSVRGLSIVLLMLASYTLGLTRLSDSPWRLVLVLAAYLWVVFAMWWMVSPWRFRNMIQWMTATPERIRRFAFGRLAFAIFVMILGATALR